MNPEVSIDQLFDNARTYRFFTDRSVDDQLLISVYEMAKFAPSSSNLSPLRITFVRSGPEKQKVMEAASAGNKPKINSAPVVAIMAYDRQFFQFTSRLAPHMNAEEFAAKDPEILEKIAFENSWLQAGAFIIAARAHGLDCGPIGGFDKSQIDEAFYPDGRWRSIFLLNLGYGDALKLKPRGDRLSFAEACRLL